jgi:hypothetical protein
MVAVSGTSLERVKIADLRPTQMTLGYHEVRRKRETWRAQRKKLGEKYIEHHMIPAVLGPKQHYYLVDHHHLARALHEEGVEHILVVVLARLDRLEKYPFWVFLDNHSWVHPFDADGRRRDYGKIPKRVADMQDDPYRSVAGELRRAGGFAKDATPFTEFMWADALRPRIERKTIERDFGRAMEQALRFARSADADYLPGWSGPSSD